MPKWDALPPLAIANRCVKGGAQAFKPVDHEASYKIAWDAHNL